MSANLRVIGIDPGTRHVGFGIVEAQGSRLIALAQGTIKAKGETMAERLVTIHIKLQEVIDAHQPTDAAIETVFAGENIKTAIAIGEGRGVAVLSAAERGLTIANYEPATVKRAVAGNGRASKEQIQEMVKRLLGLPELPPTDHEADALAMAITHIHRARLGLPAKAKPRPRRRPTRGSGHRIARP